MKSSVDVLYSFTNPYLDIDFYFLAVFLEEETVDEI
jgi:hypothetical protein